MVAGLKFNTRAVAAVPCATPMTDACIGLAIGGGLIRY